MYKKENYRKKQTIENNVLFLICLPYNIFNAILETLEMIFLTLKFYQ